MSTTKKKKKKKTADRKSSSSSQRMIRMRGVRVHNLKNIDLDIPHRQWISICGLSGSGKTSLALDTLYAEGQRRYMESLSPYTRQFLQQLEKPDADRIEGIPPSVAVRAVNRKTGARATVGSTTGTAEHLRLLFSKTSEAVCPDCDSRIQCDSPDSAAYDLAATTGDKRLQIAFSADRELDPLEALTTARRNGFGRAVIGGRSIELSGDIDPWHLTPQSADVLIVVDRLKTSTSVTRISESLETAFHFGGGRCKALIHADSASENTTEIDGRHWSTTRLSRELVCGQCGFALPSPDPKLFSSNSALGACTACEGFGSVYKFDMDLIVPDKSLSIREGAIAPWNTPSYEHELDELLELADDYDIPVDQPFSKLKKKTVQLIWDGVPERSFGGLTGFFNWLERRKYKMHLRVFLSRWRTAEPCPDCDGDRLNKAALGFRVGDKNYAQLSRMKLNELLKFFDELQLTDARQEVSSGIRNQIETRLRYLNNIGLSYLWLDRQMRTLSAGEAARVGLTTSLSSTLVNMLYVLDEPSAGLHPQNIENLRNAIGDLNQRGNTVVVVDHDPDIITSSHRVIEIGPAAGVAGGEIVFDGTPAAIRTDGESITGQYLSGERGYLISERREPRGRIKLHGAAGNNLRNIDVEFPLGCLCVVTGVSGAGKSTLVQETLYPAICRKLNKNGPTPLPHRDVTGLGPVKDVILFDQSPPGKSSRSNPVTYVKAFDEIRKAFAETQGAQARGLTAKHFSFNVKGGRCDRCEGDGFLRVDMQFMADIHMKCEQCNGARYRDEVLAVQYRGRNIADVLDMTVREAFAFFRGQVKLQSKLKALIDVGLEYIRLGQSAATMSSGEAQRLKLALHLNVTSRGRSLFVLDEPTCGLHMNDVAKLVECFESLISVGHSMVVVEHDLSLIKHADWVIDIGPGAADDGGLVVAQGTPEEVAANPDSATGRFLKHALEI